MIQVYCYDEQGFFTISKFVEELGENMTTETWQGLYKPKWDGIKWVEGATQSEIDNLNNQPQPLTEVQRIASIEQALNDMIMMMI